MGKAMIRLRALVRLLATVALGPFAVAAVMIVTVCFMAWLVMFSDEFGGCNPFRKVRPLARTVWTGR